MVRSWSSFFTPSADGGGELTVTMGLVVGEGEVVESVVGVSGGPGIGLSFGARDSREEPLALIWAMVLMC